MYKTIQPPCGRGNAFPLWWLAPPPCPVGSMSLDSRVAGLPYESSSFATSRGNEKIGGTGYCVTYDTDSQSRNADFISIARRAIHNPRPEGPSNLRTLRPIGPVHLKNPFPQPFSSTLLHNPPPTGGHNPRGEAPSTYPSEPSEPFEPSEPSHRRRVHSVHRLRCHL